MDESNATEIKARRKKTKSDVSSSGVSVCCGDQHLKGNTSLRESEEIEIATEQNCFHASRIRKLETASNEDQANFRAQLQECQSKVDSLESEKQTLLERIEMLNEQNKRQAKFLVQVACVLSRPASIVCILAIIVGVCLHCNNIINMASENHLLRERNATLTEQNNRQSWRIKKLEADSDRFDIQIGEQKVRLDAMNSDNLLLRQQTAFENKQNGALTEQINRQSSQIKKLEKDSDRFDIQLREQKLKLDAMNSENLLLRQQIAFANEQKEFLQSQLTSKSVELREKNEKATEVRLQESQFHRDGVNYLVRCLRDKDSASESFAGINLFWGALQVGYTTKNGLDNCLTMYEAQYHQRISYTL